MLKTFRYFMRQRVKYSTKVGIVGVPFDKGQRKCGTNLAPGKLREFGLIPQLREIEDIDIRDYGDVVTTPDVLKDAQMENMLELAEVSECNKQLSKKVMNVLNDNRICVTIGGDHSIGIGTVDGHLKHNDNTIVIWVDAHADINTNKTTPSSNIHGMALGVVLKELQDYWTQIPSMEWMTPKLSARSLAFIGLRSVDDYEKLIIDKNNILAFGSEDVERYGMDSVVEMVLQRLDPYKTRPIHVSFDIDALDVFEAPSTGTCVRGGLSLREGVFLMEKLYNTGRLKGIDLVEVNPLLGTERDVTVTMEAAVAILKAGLGFNRRGVAPKRIKDIPK